VWGKYCVGEKKREERGGVRLVGDHVVVLQGGSALRECNLVNSWIKKDEGDGIR
jgi:hypothetical protein